MLDNPFIYLSVDKGNKKGNKNLAKFLCWYDKTSKRVRIFLTDVDCTDESTEQIVDGIAHSLKKYLPNVERIRLKGQCTDSGGGGVKNALQRELRLRDLIGGDYLLGTCTLHNLQTGLRNAVCNVLGD